MQFTILVKFQSLSGFLARCNAASGIKSALNTLFQSLSGFLARCNFEQNSAWGRPRFRFNPCRVFLLVATLVLDTNFVAVLEFQSLSGFLARCNFRNVVCIVLIVHMVSIPVGFSCSLQPCLSIGCLCNREPFQSLSGFLARCNRFRRSQIIISIC